MKKTVIAWGRMNPPTIGHEKLVNRVRSIAKQERGDPRVYLTHTQNPKKDPLSYRDKIKIAGKAFGKIVKPSTSRTIIELMKELERAGYKQVTVVAGSDRVREYNTLLNKYNEKEYTFENIKVVSAGERDPDAEGAQGMSATKMRLAAADGEEEKFHSGAPSGLSKVEKAKLYNMTRKGMFVEEIEMFLEKIKKDTEIDDKDFSDKELKKAVNNIKEEEDEEEEDDFYYDGELNERAPLTIQQRMKKARTMKRLAPKMKRLRQIKKFRMAPTERLQNRARRMAKNLLRKKFAGAKGGRYSSLSPSEKITIDRLVVNKTPIIDKLAKRMMPMIRKKEIERIRQARRPKSEQYRNIVDSVQKLLERDRESRKLRNKQYKEIVETVETLFEETSTRQDPDIEDRKGTQPARYHSGLSKSTKAARDAQFKKQSKMASDDPRAYKPAPGDATAKTKPSKYTKRYKDLFGEGEAVQAAKDRIKREKEQDKAKHDAVLDRARLRDTRTANRQEETELTEKSMDALKKKAEKSGHSYGTLKKVYDRGVAAWRTGHRPGTTPQQWGYGRVNAFIAKKKAGNLDHDKDLANEYIPEHIHKKQLVYNPNKMTKNFDICPGAAKAFNDNQKAGLEPNEGFEDAADAVDKYLGYEKQLVKKGSASEAELDRFMELVDVAKEKISDAKLPGHTYHQGHIDTVKALMKDIKEEAPTIGGVKMKKLGSGKPGSYTNLVKKHLGARAAEKIDKSDGNKLIAKGKKTGNSDLVRKGSFIKNVIAKEEVEVLDESLKIEKGAGTGTFMTASDLGFQFQGAFEHHPSVQAEIEEEGGAGEEGTTKLKDKYKKETPGQ